MPQVDSLLRSIIQLKTEHFEADNELNRINQRITLLGGSIVPRDRLLHLKKRRNETALELKQVLEEIEKIGCQLKDADIGLIDFPTLYRGEEVYLCWKLGEQGITHWHHVQDGFAGRKLIDNEFLANHKGDLAQ